jgi:phosphoribosylamine--glycine ligase
MRILIIGSGGREHAIARALARSPKNPSLYFAPGNPGTAQLGTNVERSATDLDGLVDYAQNEYIDLTVVGPEQPLVSGLVDRFEAVGMPIVGPTSTGALLEGSKAFAKAFMDRHDIPTADFRSFHADEYDDAVAYVESMGAPIVVKASGLAGGKGALICETEADATEALDRMLREREFGQAGDRVVIEEYMEGQEASVFALTDGDHYVLLAPSQDHKTIGEEGTGPNTGGMGAYAPASVVSGGVLTQICRDIIEPTLAGMSDEGEPYRGILYCGLMITDDGPKVVEYNCRLGDPEAQVVLPLVESDLVEVFQKLARRELRGVRIEGSSDFAVCVVLASEGYPMEYETGFPITGIDDAEAVEGVSVIHAGTKRLDDDTLVTDGGRVLNVVATGPDLETAIERAYEGAEHIEFEGKTFRSDIGRKGLASMA